MTLSTGILIYVMIWVVLLFMVLPWGVNMPERVEKGHANSAPLNPHLGLKFLITTALSALLWVVAFLVLRK
jgi:predicted secreted protein